MPKRILILTPSSLREQEPQFVEAVKKAEPAARVYGAFSYFDRKQGDVVALRPDLEPLAAWAVFAGEGEVAGRSIFTDYVMPWSYTDAEGDGRTVTVGRVNGAIVRTATTSEHDKGFGLLLFDASNNTEAAADGLWWLEATEDVNAALGSDRVVFGSDDASSVRAHARARRILKEAAAAVEAEAAEAAEATAEKEVE